MITHSVPGGSTICIYMLAMKTVATCVASISEKYVDLEPARDDPRIGHGSFENGSKGGSNYSPFLSVTNHYQ